MQEQHTERRYDWGAGTGMQFTITRSTEATSGELLELTQWFAPGMAGPPVHEHPAEETFEVTEGEIEVLLNGTWSRFETGETAVVPEGAPHSVRNLSAEPAVVVNIHRPATRMEAFFVEGAKLVGEGKIKNLPPKDPRSAIYAAMLFTKYDRDLRVTNPQRALFRALSLVGRTVGCTLSA
jgi:quercetin dioxygenase-like cupin family protein